MILSKKQNTFGNENSKENEEDTLRLFSSSRCALNLDSPEPAPSRKRMRPHIGRNTKKLFQANKDQDSDSDVEDQRLAEAAISGHQILSFAAFSPSFYQSVETFNKDDTDDSPHMKSMRTTNGSDCALNQSKDKIKNRELKEDDYFEVVKKKKKVDTNTDDGDEKVDEENGQSGVVGPLLHSRQNDQYGQLHHVDKYSYSKHKKKEKKCKPRKDYKQSVEEERVKAGSGKYLLNEKANSHSEEAVDQRRKKKKVKKEKKELK